MPSRSPNQASTSTGVASRAPLMTESASQHRSVWVFLKRPSHLTVTPRTQGSETRLDGPLCDGPSKNSRGCKTWAVIERLSDSDGTTGLASACSDSMVPEVGLEPTRACTHRCLSLSESVRRCPPMSAIRAQSGVPYGGPSAGVATTRCYHPLLPDGTERSNQGRFVA